MELQGQVLVVTGGARGIGRACAQLWRDRGGRAATLDVKSPDSDPEPDLLDLQADITSEPQVADAFATVSKQYGRIDAVFHNAGFLDLPHKLEAIDLEMCRAMVDVHLMGGFIISKIAVPHLRAVGGGALVFNASITALTGSPQHPAYAAAKAGLMSLTISLARLLGRDRIRVNAVCPGSVTDTGLLEHSRGHPITPTELAAVVTRVPLGRAAVPRDVAESVCFLASSRATHITGAILPIDGGERLGFP